MNDTAEPKPEAPAKKTVAIKKQRYFVPELGRSVEAKDMAEVEAIVKKETATPTAKASGKGEITKG